MGNLHSTSLTSWAVRIFISLLLGAAATWVSAWICTINPATAWHQQWTLTGWYFDRDGQRVDVNFAAVQGPGRDDSRFSVGDPAQAERMWTQMRERPNIVFANEVDSFCKFGLPLFALGYQSYSVQQRSSAQSPLDTRTAFAHLLTVNRATARAWHWPWGAPGGGNFRLPLLVLPFGFAVDTLFWGALVFALLISPRVVRRYRRHLAGLCLECGYNLTGLPTNRCPECGQPFDIRQLTRKGDEPE
jgi:hypothetical protein